MPPPLVPLDDLADREVLALERGGPAASHSDTVWFGGSGTGDGKPVRGGLWNWEAEWAGEIEEYFRDGDEVGNRYRDGWTFDDRTARNGPSAVGSGHWRADGAYEFDEDGGSFAHRATTHANDGARDGPDPLAEPGVGGSWSVWIGTNLFLNPEHCGWVRTAGYDDGWSQGIRKTYAIEAPAGTPLAVRFFHRYAVEAGSDTCWVEISFDGEFWDQVGSASRPDGIYSGGTRGSPLPAAAGAVDEVPLLVWPGGAANLRVRFRLASDAFLSDATEGGDFLYGWQLDNIRLLAGGAPLDEATFESGMDGWEPAAFEGFDFAITTEAGRPAGRILRLNSLGCPPILDCPEDCGLEGRIVVFTDKDDCDLNDSYMQSFITSPAFAIGGPENPDIDGDEGRLLQLDLYVDGGAGFFETGPAFCWVYWPYDWLPCPYTPPAGHPGEGTTFNWSQADLRACDYYSQGVGPDCHLKFTDNLSNNLPAGADSVILHVGAYSACRYDPACDINDNGAPFYDNVRFGVFDAMASTVQSGTPDRYADNFPTTNGSIAVTTARMDGAYSRVICGFGGCENPLRAVRGDSALAATGESNTAVFLRFRVTPGACQPNLGHAFFAAFPPGQWHAARMDTARTQGTGINLPGTYMTCFHESDPRNGTYWTGFPPAVEPCDDILPDGLFTPGTVVHYFFEARDATTGSVTGTFPPRADGGPIGTDPSYRGLWLETGVLPGLDPACDGTYANNLLVVYDYASQAVPGAATVMRDRLTATLSSLGLGFDVYDVVATNYNSYYDGIGRREDRPTQRPRPPTNGATDLQLAPYDCIWYTSGLLESGTLSDRTTLSLFGGQPSIDQQKLEAWISGCTDARPRLLVLEGLGWASDIDVNTTHGPAFLSRFGVDVLADDYARDLAGDDLRRCARLAGTAVAPAFDGEVFGSGCPENLRLDVLGAVASGEAVASFVESLEDGDDPVSCADDQNRPAWHAVVRKRNPSHPCEHSVAMSFPFAYLYPLDCTSQCLFDDFRINGESAELVIDLFQWAGRPINPAPIGAGEPQAPRLASALEQARPNPARSAVVIRYSVAERGRVTLRVFDVSGRLVRVLADGIEEPGPREVVWDGRAAAGVYFYELRAPGFEATRKLVVLR